MLTVKYKVNLIKKLLYLKDVIDLGKLQDCADKNGIKQSNLSTLVSDLEKELDVSLLSKTSTGVIPTNVAQQVYKYIEEIEEILSTIQLEFIKKNDLSGVITIWAEEGFISTYILGIISDFYAKYPKIRLDILTGKEVNLSKVDIALVDSHMNKLPNAKKLFTIERETHFYTTEKYLKNHPMPESLEDLLENSDLCIWQQYLSWPECRIINKYAKHLNTTADMLPVITNLIKSGAGIGLFSNWCKKQSPELIKLNHINFSIHHEMYAVCKNGNEKQAKIKALVELFQTTLKN